MKGPPPRIMLRDRGNRVHDALPQGWVAVSTERVEEPNVPPAPTYEQDHPMRAVNVERKRSGAILFQQNLLSNIDAPLSSCRRILSPRAIC
jgi:hypothetical protein